MSADPVARRVASRDEFEAALALRYTLLRAPWGQPRGSERDEFDLYPPDEARAVLVCVVDAGRVIGTGRVQRVDAHTAQLRYLAVDESARRRGVARALIEARVAIAREWGCARVFCNARETSAPLFARLGFAHEGPGPTMFGSVAHVRMARAL